MSHENAADLFAALQAARTKSKCIELLALAADCQEVLAAGTGTAASVLCSRAGAVL